MRSAAQSKARRSQVPQATLAAGGARARGAEVTSRRPYKDPGGSSTAEARGGGCSKGLRWGLGNGDGGGEREGGGWGGGFMGELSVILARMEAGDARAGGELWELVHGELRRLAAQKLAREQPGQTLQATALVHEAWLRLGGEQQSGWRSRAHFFASAAQAMRRILVEAARRRKAERHGGGWERVSIEGFEGGNEVAAPMADDQFLRLHEALERLAAGDRVKAELVQLRFFGGLTLEEAARVLGISLATAKRHWSYARAWLFREMGRG